MRAPPLPVLASAEARAFLAQPIPEAVFRHAPQSPDEWRALIDRFNALRADAVETLRALLPVRIDTVTIAELFTRAHGRRVVSLVADRLTDELGEPDPRERGRP